MNVKTGYDNSILRMNSMLFWFTLVMPVAIIAIGINFILNPVGASTAFGIPIHDSAAFPYMWIKGIRDIFAGLVIGRGNSSPRSRTSQRPISTPPRQLATSRQLPTS